MNEEKLNKTISTYNWNSYECKKRYTVQYHITEYAYENTVRSLTNTFKVFQKSYREKKAYFVNPKTPQNNFYGYLERRTSLCNFSVNFHRNNGLHICINFDGHAQFLNGSSFRSKSYMLFHKPRQTQQIDSHSSLLFPNVRNLHSALLQPNIHTCISKQEMRYT